MVARVAVRVADPAVAVMLAGARRVAGAAAGVDDASCGAAEKEREASGEKREGSESSKAHAGESNS